MAAAREKRATAGNRMSRLLEAEDEDEFYKTTYGGFDEEEEDHDYSSEGSGTDEVDSDFDIDETDQLKSDDEDDAPKRKKRGVDTKAYKEVLKKKSDVKPKKVKYKKEKKEKKEFNENFLFEPIAKKSLRRSTANKTAELEKKRKERELHSQRLKEIAQRKNVSDVRRLTQEELLEEAKQTEIINLKSLEMYQQLELERRRVRTVKHQYQGPIIRYQSVAMPLIEEIQDEVNVEDENDEISTKVTGEKCERTFITFTEECTFHECFPQKSRNAPIKPYCAVTRKPAKYFDPLTRLPYGNIEAFKALRQAHDDLMNPAYNESLLC